MRSVLTLKKKLLFERRIRLVFNPRRKNPEVVLIWGYRTKIQIPPLLLVSKVTFAMRLLSQTPLALAGWILSAWMAATFFLWVLKDLKMIS